MSKIEIWKLINKIVEILVGRFKFQFFVVVYFSRINKIINRILSTQIIYENIR